VAKAVEPTAALTPERLRRHGLLRALRDEILAAEKWNIIESLEG
jgi:hypothetical protein